MKNKFSIYRFRAIIASAALAAVFAPLSAHAATPDAATEKAIASWRSATVALVEPAFQDIVSASYENKTLTTDGGWFNTAMMKRAVAEQAAWSTLDPAAVALITNYYYVDVEAGAPDQSS